MHVLSGALRLLTGKDIKTANVSKYHTKQLKGVINESYLDWKSSSKNVPHWEIESILDGPHAYCKLQTNCDIKFLPKHSQIRQKPRLSQKYLMNLRKLNLFKNISRQKWKQN